MTKQRGRGGKRGRKAKKGMGGKRDMVYKEEGQEYGQITKLLGNGTATVMCIDGRPRLGIICGRMKNRVWIQVNDIVLVSLREFEDGGKKCDIIYKYFAEEAKQLKALGELPDETVIEDRPKEDEINLVYEQGEQEQEEEEEDDDDDLPPEDSDDEVYLKEKALVLEGKYGKKPQKPVEESDSDDEEEDKGTNKAAKPEPEKGGKKGPIGNVKPAPGKDDKKAVAKVDSKKNAQQKKKDVKKKQAGGDDSGSEDSKDKLDDI